MKSSLKWLKVIETFFASPDKGIRSLIGSEIKLIKLKKVSNLL